jgi:uncharacterized membrane protein
MRPGKPNGIMYEGNRFEGRVHMTEHDARTTAAAPASERDPRLERLLAVADGVYAIALTLLAVELALPASAADLRGDALLPALLESWPKVLGYANSFTAIAIFWQAHHRLFLQVRRFDGTLLWLVFLQLGCVAFIPFPTAVIGEHVGNPVAQEFYFGTLLVNGLAWVLLRWYATAGHRLVSPDLSSRDLRLYLRLSLAAPVVFLVLMALIVLGAGRLINPLLLGYLLALGYIAFAGANTWEQRREGSEAAEGARSEGAPAKEQRANDEDANS